MANDFHPSFFLADLAIERNNAGERAPLWCDLLCDLQNDRRWDKWLEAQEAHYAIPEPGDDGYEFFVRRMSGKVRGRLRKRDKSVCNVCDRFYDGHQILGKKKEVLRVRPSYLGCPPQDWGEARNCLPDSEHPIKGLYFARVVNGSTKNDFIILAAGGHLVRQGIEMQGLGHCDTFRAIRKRFVEPAVGEHVLGEVTAAAVSTGFADSLKDLTAATKACLEATTNLLQLQADAERRRKEREVNNRRKRRRKRDEGG